MMSSSTQRTIRPIVVLCLVIFTAFTLAFYSAYDIRHQGRNIVYETSTDVYEKASCPIPVLDPWDPGIRQYLKPSQRLKCTPSQELLPLISKLQNGTLTVVVASNNSAAQWSRLCQWRCIFRAIDSDYKITNGNWTTFNLSEEAKPTCEIVEVACSRSDGVRYQMVHSQIVANETRLAEAQRAINASKSADGNAPPTVLVLTFESTSRSMFLRRLPKTYRYLTEELGAFNLRGYTKIGLNSYPNVAAFMTGMRVYSSELPKSQVKGPYDDFPLIHKEFHKLGYITYWAENWGVFNYLAKGFKYKPTDHFMRPFFLAIEKSVLYHNQRKQSKGAQKWCYGQTPAPFALLTENLVEFLQKYPINQPKFAFLFESLLAHDTPENLGMTDDYYLDMLKKIQPTLNNTFVFVLGDHGHRFSAVRRTEIGRLEEKMPFSAVVVPPRFRSQLSRVFQLNKMRLSSHWDTYVTFWDIILSQQHGWNFTVQPDDWSKQARRGLSLLRPLPLHRTCEAASIPMEYCVCDHGRSINVSAVAVRAAVDFAVAEINRILVNSNVSQLCEQLQLKKIHNAAKVGRGGNMEKRVVFETTPNNGIFEAHVIDRSANNFTIRGRIDRINKYGKQPDCLSDFTIRPYCLCKKR